MQLNLTQLPRTPSHEPGNSKIFMLSFYLGRHFSIEQREKDLDYLVVFFHIFHILAMRIQIFFSVNTKTIRFHIQKWSVHRHEFSLQRINQMKK